MILAFDTKALRELCVSETKAKQKLGDAVAECLKRRVADMRAANTLADLAAFGALEPTETDTVRHVVLNDGQFLVVAANAPVPPMDADGKISWAAINRVKLVRIGPP